MKKIFVVLSVILTLALYSGEADARRGRDRPGQQPQRQQQQQQPQQQQRQPDASDYAGGIVNLTNAERRAQGRANLAVDNELMAAAALRARELESRFSHDRPDGRGWDTVLREYNVRSYNRWGENILYNMSNDPAAAMEQWMNSPGHRNNILTREYTHIGVGVHQSGGRTYVVQIFVGR